MDTKELIITKPSRGKYTPDCLSLETRTLPNLKDGEILLKTIYISVDPTSRNWLKLEPDSTYFPLAVGDPMIGQAVCIVEESKADGYIKGDIVNGMSTWSTYSIVQPTFIGKAKADIPLQVNLSIFSHIGYAAAAGMIGIGDVKADDTVVVSAAAGATGSLAAQIAKSVGARVIGIAGGAEKCRLLTDELGLDGAIDYKSDDIDKELTRLCPDGVTLFFDNVGGAILDAVLIHLTHYSRIALCGQIALYDSTDRNDGQGVRNLMQLVFRRVRMEGFIAGDPIEDIPKYDAALLELYNKGKLKVRSHVIDGLEQAPDAISLLLAGKNQGKVMVQVSPEP